MNTKHIRLAAAMISLFSCIACKAQFDNGMVPTNSSWHSLNTNSLPPELEDQIERSLPSNFTLWIRPLGGVWAWTTNAEDFWLGNWKETNGMRVQLNTASSASNYTVSVQVGNFQSKIDPRNKWFTTPNRKFAKLELINSGGHVMQLKPTAGTNLLKGIIVNYKTNSPAWALPSAETLIADFPIKLTTNTWPLHMEIGIHMSVRGHPQIVSSFNIYDLYSITNEDDYMLTVQPVLYMQKSYDSEFLDRVDLPSITTKVHLVPNVK